MRRLGCAFALLLVAAPAAAQEEPAPAPEPAPVVKPSIVLDVKDDQGRSANNVTIIVDDKVIAYELVAGRPIELEPGPHTITVQRNDGPIQRATTRITVDEGDANRAVHLAFERATEPAPVLEKPDNAPLAPRIVAGVGLAGVATGVVLLLARPSLPTNCNSDTYTCTKLPAETEAQFKDERDTAGTNHGLFVAGLTTLAAGAGVTALGVLWYVLEMPKPRTATVVAPWLQGSGGGVTLRAAF